MFTEARNQYLQVILALIYDCGKAAICLLRFFAPHSKQSIPLVDIINLGPEKV